MGGRSANLKRPIFNDFQSAAGYHTNPPHRGRALNFGISDALPLSDMRFVDRAGDAAVRFVISWEDLFLRIALEFATESNRDVA